MVKTLLVMMCLWGSGDDRSARDCTMCKKVYEDYYVEQILECRISPKIQGVRCSVILNNGQTLTLPNPDLGNKVVLPEIHCYK